MFSVAAYADKFVFITGGIINRKVVNTVLAYDVTEQQFCKAEDSPVPSMKDPRLNHSSVVCGHKLAVFGGKPNVKRSLTLLPTIEILDVKNGWKNSYGWETVVGGNLEGNGVFTARGLPSVCAIDN